MPTAARLAFLAAEYREAIATDGALPTVHLLSPQLIEASTLITEADAQAEATRRQALRGVRRDRYEFTAQLNDDTEDIDLGTILELSHDRFGLSAGQLFVVLGLDPDGKNNTLKLNVWG